MPGGGDQTPDAAGVPEFWLGPVLRIGALLAAVLRTGLISAAVALSLTAVPLTLPVLPAADLRSTPIVQVNYDAGDTVGWPAYVREIAAVYGSLPAAQRSSAVVLASNYGEAGAVDRYGQAAGLPPAYSGHNGYWHWGRRSPQRAPQWPWGSTARHSPVSAAAWGWPPG